MVVTRPKMTRYDVYTQIKIGIDCRGFTSTFAPMSSRNPPWRSKRKTEWSLRHSPSGLHSGFCSRGGQNSCFRIPEGASATCCTLQYIYIVKFQGGGECPLNKTLSPNLHCYIVCGNSLGVRSNGKADFKIRRGITCASCYFPKSVSYERSILSIIYSCRRHDVFLIAIAPVFRLMDLI